MLSSVGLVLLALLACKRNRTFIAIRYHRTCRTTLVLNNQPGLLSFLLVFYAACGGILPLFSVSDPWSRSRPHAVNFLHLCSRPCRAIFALNRTDVGLSASIGYLNLCSDRRLHGISSGLGS
ncbi:hypothetical protein BDZ45DRAFT_345929 [Acephala macrosclerotiorum]|nr:hypothetical protein BDZ45DRAFT_345929 [Acephala macrosclerotiorum]